MATRHFFGCMERRNDKVSYSCVLRLQLNNYCLSAGARILTAPYEDRDGCILNAMLVNGTLYLEEHLTDAKLAEKCFILNHHLCARSNYHLVGKILHQGSASRLTTATRLSLGARLPVLEFLSESLVIP